MKQILNSLEKKTISQLQCWIVLLASLIAAQMQYIQHGWINPDTILYFEAAKLFSNGEWSAGFDIFAWPFYALCIALVNTITQLGVHVSAQILNVLFFAIATYSYIKIILLAGGKQKQIIAGALIWLSAQYMIGSVLEMLMRDEGFWAFYLLSIAFFMRFYQTHQLKHALLWQVCIIVATLFRIEAILYLMFLPLVLLFQEELQVKQRWKHVLMAMAINIGLAILIVTVFTFNEHLSTKLLGRLNEVFTTNLWQQFTQHLIEKSNIMSSQVLGQYLEEFAVQGILITFIYIMFVKTISATGTVNIILSALAIKHHKQLMQPSAYKVLRAVAIIALLNMALIITKVFVLSGRYILALSFILMIFAAFYFAELLFNGWQNKRLKWLSIMLVVFMLGGTIKNILPKKQGYNYIQDAVAWIQKNNPDNKPVFYSEKRARFYANQIYDATWDGQWPSIENTIKSKSIYQYEYLVIGFSKDAKQHELFIKNQLKDFQEINRFYDVKHKKYMTIYRKT